MQEELISSLELMHSSEYRQGDLVKARRFGKTRYHPGLITTVNRLGTYDILYDDGEKEVTLTLTHPDKQPCVADCVRPPKRITCPQNPNPTPTNPTPYAEGSGKIPHQSILIASEA